MKTLLERNSVKGDGVKPSINIQERRQMGGVALIVRPSESDDGQEVYLTRDPDAKFGETAGSVRSLNYTYQPPNGRRNGGELHSPWSVFGGGRQSEETLVQTIARELSEESHILDLAKEKAVLNAFIGQIAAFLASQISKFDSNKIDVFAVAGMVLEFSKLPNHIQKALDKLVASESGSQAAWVSLAELARLYELLVESNSYQGRVAEFRPHTLMAAYIWQLQQTLEMNQVAQIIDQHNVVGYKFAHRYAEEHRFIDGVNNGAFDTDGHLLTPDQLSFGDAAFLYSNLAHSMIELAS